MYFFVSLSWGQHDMHFNLLGKLREGQHDVHFKHASIAPLCLLICLLTCEYKAT